MRQLLHTLAAYLYLSGCSTHLDTGLRTAVVDVCETRCGLLLPTDSDCVAGRALEDAFVRNVGNVLPIGPQGVCGRLAGWRVVRVQRRPLDLLCGQAWLMGVEGGELVCAVGYTDLMSRTITLHTTQWDLSELPHELVHVVYGKPGHCLWGNPDVRAALWETNGHVDTSAPEPEVCD